VTEHLIHPQVERQCPFDPPDAYRERAKTSPISHVSVWDGSLAWLITRHEDVRTILRDPRFSSNADLPGMPYPSQAAAASADGENKAFIKTDDPEHARQRRMLTGEFRVGRVEAFRSEVKDIVATVINRMISDRHEADLVEDFALAIPSLVICVLLGVPYDDHDVFQRLSAEVMGKHADHKHRTVDDVRAAHQQLGEYLHALAERKSHEPGDDVLSRLIARHEVQGDITRDDVVSMARLLLIAGHETTANMIGLSVLALLRHPQQLKQLIEHPDRANAAVEELLRYLTVIQRGEERVATADVDFRGHKIKAGDGVICLLSTANRDPQVFEMPESLDLERDARRHVAFGYGVHQCLGQSLARLELEIALVELFRRVPTLELAVPFEELTFSSQSMVYGLHRLPVRW
jgi:cytochrome P450